MKKYTIYDVAFGFVFGALVSGGVWFIIILTFNH